MLNLESNEATKLVNGTPSMVRLVKDAILVRSKGAMKLLTSILIYMALLSRTFIRLLIVGFKGLL